MLPGTVFNTGTNIAVVFFSSAHMPYQKSEKCTNLSIKYGYKNEIWIKKKDFIIFISNRTWSGICDLSYRARPQLALKDCRLHYCFNDWMVSMLLPPLPYCFFSQRNVHMLSFQVLMATLLIYMDWYHHNVLANFLHQHNLTILYEI